MSLYKLYRCGHNTVTAKPAVVATNDGVNWDTILEVSAGFSAFVSFAIDPVNNRLVALSGSDIHGLWVGPADGSGAFQQVTSPLADAYGAQVLRFLNGKFYLFINNWGTGALEGYTSADGLTWTVGGTVTSTYSVFPQDGVYFSSKVVVGQLYDSDGINSPKRPGVIYSTTEGTTWSVGGLLNYPNYFGGSTRLAAGASRVWASSLGNLLYSDNGSTWVFHHAASSTTYCIASDGDQTFVVGGGLNWPSVGMHYSTDNGVNWYDADVPGAYSDIVDIRYSNGQWIAFDWKGRLFTAPFPTGPWTDYGITCPIPDAYIEGISMEAFGALPAPPAPPTYFWKNYVNANEVL